jgi:hypothetical protein
MVYGAFGEKKDIPLLKFSGLKRLAMAASFRKSFSVGESSSVPVHSKPETAMSTDQEWKVPRILLVNRELMSGQLREVHLSWACSKMPGRDCRQSLISILC